MRLREVYYTCKAALLKWKNMEFQEREYRGVRYHKLKNTPIISKDIKELNVVEILRDDISNLYTINPDLRIGKNSGLELLDKDKEDILSVYNNIKYNLAIVVNLCESLHIAESENGLDVRIPDQLALADFAKCVDDINAVLTQTPFLRDVKDCKVSLDSVDIGSVWVTIALVGEGAVHFLNALGDLVKKALSLCSQKQELEAQRAIAAQAKAKADFAENLLKVHKEYGDMLLDAAKEELATKHEVEKTDGEEMERLGRSLELLMNWFDKGLEIYPALSSGAEIQAAFPTREEQQTKSLGNTFKKMLEAHKENDSAEERKTE